MFQSLHDRRSRPAFAAAVLSALLAATLGCRSAAPPALTGEEVLYAWVELGPEGRVSARAITEAPSCPSITVGKTTVLMTPRAASAPASFEVTSCEHPVAAGARSASIDGRELRLPEKAPNRIVVVGDTGCRIKKTDVQNCNGKGSGPPWQFAEIAAAAAAAEPDLILHVGDYLYRESPCPAGNAGCAGTPYGDTWATWKTDFFEPAGELLDAAPWVFVRGNHEECKRSWRGWFYFLDPRPLGADPWQQANCQAYTPPYAVPVGGLELLVMDTSTIVNDYGETPDPQMVSQYTQEFSIVDQQAAGAGRAWFTTHRPIWALSAWLDDGTPKVSPTDLTLQAAVGNSHDHALPANVEWVVAGHVHNFEHLTFTDGRPPSTVAGGGGTKLDPAITPQLLDANPQALEELNLERDDFVTRDEFGFLVVEPDGEGWQVRLLSEAGEIEYEFRVGG